MKLKINFAQKLDAKNERVIAFGCMLHTYMEIGEKPENWQFRWSYLEKKTASGSKFDAIHKDFVKCFNPEKPDWSLDEIADVWHVNIAIYDSKKVNGCRRLLYEYIPLSRANDCVIIFDISKQDFIKADFSRCSLVIKKSDYLKPDTCDFIECYASNLNLTTKEVENAIGGCTVSFRDEKKLINAFGYGFQIVRRQQQHEHGRRSCLYSPTECVYWSTTSKFITMNVIGRWHEQKEVVYPTDKFARISVTPVLLLCKKGCGYNTLKASNLKKHEKRCTIPVKISCKQKNFVNQTTRDWLIANKYIEDVYFNNFAVFDIETVCPEITHKTVLISLATIFGEDGSEVRRSQVFCRKNMTKAGLDKLVKEFATALDKAQKQLIDHFPFTDALERLKKEKAAILQGELSVQPMVANHIKAGASYLQGLLKLGVYGFNSERYDVPILYPDLVQFFMRKGAEPKMIKAGAGIMRLQFFKIYFADIKRFISGGSLASFAKTWGADEPKGLFPYDHFKTIEQMKHCHTWPKFEKFHSVLDLNKHSSVKNPLSEFADAYEEARQHDDSRYLTRFRDQFNLDRFFNNLPVDNVELDFSKLTMKDDGDAHVPVSPKAYMLNWVKFESAVDKDSTYNMYAHFARYCGNDAEITRDAFYNYVKRFQHEYRVNPLECFSLPSMANRIIWSMYDTNVNAPYSFGANHTKLNELVRANIRGGLSCVFHRHVEIGETKPATEREYPDCVYNLPNGQPNESLVSLDYNSKYLSFSCLILMYV